MYIALFTLVSCYQSSSSNHKVEYHPLLVEIADTYCSIYAEPAELAIDIMDLRAQHRDALNSGDLSCSERKKLANEMEPLFIDFEEAVSNADDKMIKWCIEESLDLEDFHLAPLSYDFCPEVQHTVMIIYDAEVLSLYDSRLCDD